MDVEHLYNSVKFDGSVELRPVERQGQCQLSCRQLETRCGRESHIRGKGPLGPDELGSREDADKMQ